MSPDELPEGFETRQFLAERHRQNAAAPIGGADASGAFRESMLAVLFGDALPLVVDANVLRNDIGYVCRTGTRTALLSGANARTFRLYCARHVHDEVGKHAARWSEEMNLDPDLFLSVWRDNYVPLLRHVPTEGMETMLLPEERDRIERLRFSGDPDDGKSVV